MVAIPACFCFSSAITEEQVLIFFPRGIVRSLHLLGIAVSPDRSQIYISSFIEKLVHVYNMTEDIVQGELKHDEDIWVGSNIDSLSVDKHTGDIYVASHPSYSTYLRHRLGYEPQSPSHVVKIEKLAPENYIHRKSEQPDYYFFPASVPPPIKWEIKDLFYSNGEDISGKLFFYCSLAFVLADATKSEHY